MSEFDLIRRYFTRQPPAGILGVGDDCALLPSAPGAWAVSTDLLLEGRHFFADVLPQALGHKALAVNLSDLAAMGAAPRGFVLGLGLPSLQPEWLKAFSQGMHALADRHGCPLVGGDTTRSESGITISVTIFGMVDARRALRRNAAQPGDDIWVSGTLGEADLALRLMLQDRGQGRACAPEPEPPQAGVLPDDTELNGLLARLPDARRQALLAGVRGRLELPEPRVALGQALNGVAKAAIDVSDGLLQDLGHILTASHCGARLHAPALPVGELARCLPQYAAWRCALGGGDAYELCFTAAAPQRASVLRAAQQAGVPVSRIGTILADPGLSVVDASGAELKGLPGGFDHFGN